MKTYNRAKYGTKSTVVEGTAVMIESNEPTNHIIFRPRQGITIILQVDNKMFVHTYVLTYI